MTTETYLTILAITIGVEVPVVAAIFHRSWRRMAVVCLIATTATHLAMHFVILPLSGSYTTYLLTGEITATTVEAIVYAIFSRPRDIPRALIASAVANTLSFSVGLLL